MVCRSKFIKDSKQGIRIETLGIPCGYQQMSKTHPRRAKLPSHVALIS